MYACISPSGPDSVPVRRRDNPSSEWLPDLGEPACGLVRRGPRLLRRPPRLVRLPLGGSRTGLELSHLLLEPALLLAAVLLRAACIGELVPRRCPARRQ